MTKKDAIELIDFLKDPYSRGYAESIVCGIYDDFNKIIIEHKERFLDEALALSNPFQIKDTVNIIFDDLIKRINNECEIFNSTK